MTRRLRIEWRPGHKITARLAVPRAVSGPAILLAHGAGAGQSHPFVTGLRDRLAALGHPVMTFDYPYIEAGRRAPDRMPVLLESHRAALHRLQRYEWRIVLAGKSMGGRMASHLAAEGAAADGLVLYGYPLVSPSNGRERDTSHLHSVGPPMLFWAGSRDRLGPLGPLRSLVAGLPAATLEVIDGGDHSFKVLKRLGVGEAAVLDRLAAGTSEWIRLR